MTQITESLGVTFVALQISHIKTDGKYQHHNTDRLLPLPLEGGLKIKKQNREMESEKLASSLNQLEVEKGSLSIMFSVERKSHTNKPRQKKQSNNNGLPYIHASQSSLARCFL